MRCPFRWPGFAWGYLRMPLLEQQLTMVYLEPIGTGESGRLDTHPHGYTRERYAQALDGLLTHLGVPKVYLLGHSHGGFVAQYYALTRPDRLAGVILYESAPSVGPEHFTEAMRNLEEFARRNAGNPGLPDVLEAWQSIPTIADDATFTAIARRVFPAYVADYWGREAEFAPIRAAVSGSYISGLDDCLAPSAIDDRETLAAMTVPTLVIVGEHDYICGPRWAREIHDLIRDSTLVVLKDAGHFGHFEQPEDFRRAVVDFVEPTTA